MKCDNCGGRLDGPLKFCPYCGVRADVDLRQLNYRDLGSKPDMPCPCCLTSLDVLEFDFNPPVTIERCKTCYGLFFNPGELELLLESQINPLVWLDLEGLKQATNGWVNVERPVYRKCPLCSERMSHLIFGGRSGVIVDRCGQHGVWLDGGALRRLTEWWRAGGKLIHQQNEQDKSKRLFRKPEPAPVLNFPDSERENPVPPWATPPMVDPDATLWNALCWFASCILK